MSEKLTPTLEVKGHYLVRARNSSAIVEIRITRMSPSGQYIEVASVKSVVDSRRWITPDELDFLEKLQ